ncbi:hypothetical protein HDU98_001798 [Podochytrium sp. JEL0797]|nr:hypothetical protein HDU98_001798 [Podochytrium sp. JEL0797]
MTLTLANEKTGAPILTLPSSQVPPVPSDYPFNSLTQAQIDMVHSFRTHLPAITAQLTSSPCADEETFTDDLCLIRFLKATKWDLGASVKRLTETLQWRREYRPTESDPILLESHAALGGQYYSGFDKKGRPLLILISRLGASVKDYETSMRFSIYTIEKGIRLMPRGVSQLAVLVDYSGMSLYNGYPISVTSKFMGILANHYPELLGTLVVVNPSWYMPIAFGLLSPFLDPVTKGKMHFASPEGGKVVKTEKGTGGWCNILDIVDAQMLPVELGDTYPLDDLSPDQLAQVSLFRSKFLPLIHGELTCEPCPDEDVFTSDECLVRYLRATKWDLDVSVLRLQDTLQWRREYRPAEFTPGLQTICDIGGQYINGFDKKGRPIMLNIARLGSKVKDFDMSIRFSIFLLERAIQAMPRGVSQVCVVTEYFGATMFNTYPLSVTLKYLDLLGKHYPERLGITIVCNPSWYIPMLYKLIKPFTDPVTLSKIHFAATDGRKEENVQTETGGWLQLMNVVDADMLPVEFGGGFDFVLDKTVYSKALFGLE